MTKRREKTGFLTDAYREALKATCRRRKVDALVWKRARALLLLDGGEDIETVCRILDIGPTVLHEWRRAFDACGPTSLDMKDYSPRQGFLSAEEERGLKAHFTDRPARNVREVCAHVEARYGCRYSPSGAARLMRRLGFEYRKPALLPAQADEARQAAFIAWYENLLNGLLPNEIVLFSDAVHPEHQTRPAHGWFPKGQKVAVPSASGRRRLNIQGAINLEDSRFIFVEDETINAQTTRRMLEKPENAYPDMARIHVIVDNARYHRAKVLQPWPAQPDRRVKLHFLPPHSPHLNPAEGVWGLMHECVTHNRHYPTFDKFVEAVLHFLRETIPKRWHEFSDTVTDNFRIVSHDDYRLI